MVLFVRHRAIHSGVFRARAPTMSLPTIRVILHRLLPEHLSAEFSNTLSYTTYGRFFFVATSLFTFLDHTQLVTHTHTHN